MFDEDIKIADFSDKTLKMADKPKPAQGAHEEYDIENAKGNTVKAKEFGAKLALLLVDNLDRFSAGEEESENTEIAVQRGILMTFAAIVCIENEIKSSVVSQIAENSFNEELQQNAPQLYSAVGASGALSFYYLAYRRGGEVDRRIGQTFAMLCSHDGDSVYQELGEAIYCWFLSYAVDQLKESGIV
ncbi:MAG: hypothetical protein E7525_03955 [Ruminococcaceae bacterium]|nr:hypothetical protein [Oscillospiraceae bacterium]